MLETCSKPTALYLKLACDTALRWKSFTEDTHKQLKPTATELIIQLFERYELILLYLCVPLLSSVINIFYESTSKIFAEVK